MDGSFWVGIVIFAVLVIGCVVFLFGNHGRTKTYSSGSREQDANLRLADAQSGASNSSRIGGDL